MFNKVNLSIARDRNSSSDERLGFFSLWSTQQLIPTPIEKVTDRNLGSREVTATMRSRDQAGPLGPQQPGHSARFQVQGGISSCVILAHASLLPGPLGGYLCPGPKPGSLVTVHCSPATSEPCAASQSIRGSLKPSLRYFCELLPGSLAAPPCGSSQASGLLLDQTLRNSSSISYSWSLHWAVREHAGTCQLAASRGDLSLSLSDPWTPCHHSAEAFSLSELIGALLASLH